MGTFSADVERIELRCPNSTRKLLGIVRSNGQTAHVTEENLLELPCRDCRDNVYNITKNKPVRVVHLYNVLGDCVESEIVWKD